MFYTYLNIYGGQSYTVKTRQDYFYGEDYKKSKIYKTSSTLIFAAISTIILMELSIFFIDPAFFFNISIIILGSLIGLGSIRYFVPAIVGFRKLKTIEGDYFPPVTVIVSAYNEEKVLDRTIASMLEIDYPKEKLEFIYVFEEGCTDGTESIIREFAKKDERFKPMKYRGGKAACLNYAIKRSRGDIICILDADHSFERYAIKRAVSRMGQNEFYCVRGRSRVINKGDGLISRLCGIERDITERLGIYGTYLMGGFSYFGGSLGFFKREIFQEVGFFNKNVLTEDIDISARIQEAGYEICVDPSINSWEEAPSTLTGWWKQRKRWCRGWAQCAVMHLLPMARSEIPLRKRIDASLTWAYNFVPLFTVFFIPISTIAEILGMHTILSCPILASALVVIPAMVVIGVLISDKSSGERFRSEDVSGIFFMPLYLIFYGIVSVSAIIDEFVLKKPSIFIHTEKSGNVRL